MRYYLIAGEASGDLHGSNLMKSIKETDPYAEFRFFGGDLMKAQGGILVKHYKDISVMGFVAVIFKLRTILKTMALCKKDIGLYHPDVVILIDYPSFNLKIAKFVKEQLHIPVHYYISPKIWAWKEYRIKSIKKYIDRIFSILPFEVDFYSKHNYEVIYVGNPSVEAIENRTCKNETFQEFVTNNNLSKKPIVAVLAGSRKNEIKYCLPVMLETAKDFPDYQFVIAGAPSITRDFYEQIIGNNTNFKIVFGKTYNVLQQSKAALINSGTASLEAALLNTPQVVGYHVFGGKAARIILQRVIKVKYASLVNLIADRLVVKEFLADDMTTENMKKELKLLLSDETYRNNMLKSYDEVREKLGGVGAADRTAKLIYEEIK
jgi:lipid-A-disaccharide synthase